MKTKFLAIILGLMTSLAMISRADQSPANPDDLRTWVERDDFEKTTTVRIGDITITHDEVLHVGCYYRIVASRKDGGPTVFIFLLKSLRTLESSWAFWQSTADQDGKKFPLTEISSDTPFGLCSESFFAPISREYLDGIRTNGIQWRAYGKNAREDFKLEAAVIDAFLKRVDAEFSAKPKT
jgi:hypothetical protein